MTGLDFLEIEDQAELIETLRKIRIEFVANGHINIPGWEELNDEMQRLIFENGWTEKNISEIALEAAVKLGMGK